MAIKDVSKQYAAMFYEAAEEEKRYDEACKKSVENAEQLHEKEIDEFDEEELDPSDLGFSEEEVACNEVVSPLDLWKDMKTTQDKKLAGSTTMSVDNNYINKMKKLLSRIKSSKPAIYARVLAKLTEYMQRGVKLPPPEDFAENFIPFEELDRGYDRSDADAKSSFGNSMADQNLWDCDLTEAEKEAQDKEVKKACATALSQIKTIDVDKAKKFLADNKSDILTTLKKVKDEKLQKKLRLVVKFIEKFADGDLDESEIAEAKKEERSSVTQFIRGAMRLCVVILKLAPVIGFLTGRALSWLSEVTAKLLDKADKSLAESLELEVCDDEQIEEDQDAEVLGEDGTTEIENEDEVEESACQNEEDPVAHLLDPIGVKASTASLKGQDTAMISVVEMLMKKIDNLESKLDEAQFDLSKRRDTITAQFIAHKEEANVTKTPAQLTELVKRIFQENGIDTPASRRILMNFQRSRNWINSLTYYYNVIEKGSGNGVIREEEGEEKKPMSEAEYDDIQAQKSLRYEDQLKFKRWALRKLAEGAELEVGNDPFYFDYVTGVDTKTGEDIPGLVADGSLTWGQALDILRSYFSTNGEFIGEADTSFEDKEDPELEAKYAKETKSEDMKKAEALQEISYERQLTADELEEFKKIIGKLSDYEKALLLHNKTSKTGFARGSNHTGMRVTTDTGDRVEIPAYNYQLDPDDANQRVSIRKKAEKRAAQDQIAQAHDAAVGKVEKDANANAELTDDLSLQDWQAAFGQMGKREKMRLMNEIIDEMTAEYEGKSDEASKKKREEVIQCIWTMFGCDPGTRDFGKLWNVTHVGAGKFLNKTVKKLANAFKTAGIRKISDLANAPEQKFKKMIELLKKDTENQRSSWKIDPKSKKTDAGDSAEEE